MGNNFETLKTHILSMSKSSTFENAKKEWELDTISIANPLESCPCGKEKIKYLCHLKNTINGNTTFVGNVCTNKFIGIDATNVFNGLKRIKDNLEANMNIDLIVYCEERGLLKDRGFGFLEDTLRKRNLSARQLQWKRNINYRVLNHFKLTNKFLDEDL